MTKEVFGRDGDRSRATFRPPQGLQGRLADQGTCAISVEEFRLSQLVAMLGEIEAWCPNDMRGWFVEGKEAGAEPNLFTKSQRGRPSPDRVIAAADTKSVARGSDDNTCQARHLKTMVARGWLFRAPT